MIHLRRAEEAGLDRDAIADSLAVAAAVEAWPVLAFGGQYWRDWTPMDAALPRYVRMFDAARRSHGANCRGQARAAKSCASPPSAAV